MMWTHTRSRFANCASAIALIAAAPAFAEDAPQDEEIVVLGSLTPRPIAEIGSALTVLDEGLLTERQYILASDALRAVPGVSVNRTGPQGALTQVRIRGAEANHTLVYIDGVEVNDPINGAYNFASLVTADIDRIEVIRGPQSALYGSEALGGVVAITTKAADIGSAGELEFEAGSFGTTRLFGAAGLGDEVLGARLSLQRYETDGVSASPTDPEEDGFENTTVSLKAVATPFEALRFEGVVRFADSAVQEDRQDFVTGAVLDADNHTDTEDLYAKADVIADLWDDHATARAFIAFTDATSQSLSAGSLGNATDATRLDYGAQISTVFSTGQAEHQLTGAFEREELDFVNTNPFITAGENAQTDEQTSLIAEYSVSIADQLFVSAAARRDFNDVFEDAETFRLAGAYKRAETGTRLHASWGRGITDPSFNDRFGFDPDTFVGNPDLTPETSTGWDIGVEQALLGGDVVLDLTYFDADLEDEIATEFSFVDGQFLSTVVNQAGTSERSGVEATLTADLGRGFTLDAQYTNLDASEADGSTEIRRPEHSGSVSVNWTDADGRLNLNLGADYNGEMDDILFIFPPERRTLDAYTLVRLAGSYQINRAVELFARAENALDEEYEDVLGFATPGAAGYLGVRLSR